MPEIKPFCALMPAPHLQSKVVTRPLENYGMGEAKLIASENSFSYLHLINPELENPYLRGTRQELIYKRIGDNLDHFIENEVLLKDALPTIYIYQVRHDGYTQTGIWTLTAIEDYLSGHIKKHETTVERRERLLADYLQQTGLDANPVLITYPSQEEIEVILRRYLIKDPILDFTYADGTLHKVWAIRHVEDIAKVIAVFSKMPCVYIADGHHRAASMAKTGLCRYFTTVYMNTEEVRILEYNRLVRDLGQITGTAFLDKVRSLFDVELCEVPVQPAQLHDIGMYFDGQWFQLRVKPEMFNASDPVEVLDVKILQDNILEPLLGIRDPRTDARITFEGGATPIAHLQKQVDHGLFAVAFTLFPVSVEQLIDVADSNGIMPPKSTWVEPKFLVGLLTNYFK
jgi:uncharacterized protein (DUF1015 family)